MTGRDLEPLSEASAAGSGFEGAVEVATCVVADDSAAELAGADAGDSAARENSCTCTLRDVAILDDPASLAHPPSASAHAVAAQPTMR
jgi:hypothetical protein